MIVAKMLTDQGYFVHEDSVIEHLGIEGKVEILRHCGVQKN